MDSHPLYISCEISIDQYQLVAMGVVSAHLKQIDSNYEFGITTNNELIISKFHRVFLFKNIDFHDET